MKAVITVVGKDSVGILAGVSKVCANNNVNILDVNQTIMDTYFTMIMLVDMEGMNSNFEDFKENLKSEVPNMKVHVMHEDIFNSMHRI